MALSFERSLLERPCWKDALLFDGVEKETTQDQKDIVVGKVGLKGQQRTLRPTTFTILYLLPCFKRFDQLLLEKTQLPRVTFWVFAHRADNKYDTLNRQPSVIPEVVCTNRLCIL
jgi:hypothetical protein